MRYQFHLRLHNVVYIRRSSGRCHIARPLSFEQLLYHDQAVPPFVIWMRIIIVIIIIDHLDQHNLVTHLLLSLIVILILIITIIIF